MFALVMGLAFFLREEIEITLILQVLMWLQIFLIGMGRGLKETHLHYIYLVPEPPFKKIIWSNLERVLKTFLGSILLLVIPGIILGTQALIVLGSVLVYSLFTLLLLGINYLLDALD